MICVHNAVVKAVHFQVDQFIFARNSIRHYFEAHRFKIAVNIRTSAPSKNHPLNGNRL